MQARWFGDLKLKLGINIVLFPKIETSQSKSPIFNTQNNNVSFMNQAQRADASKMVWGFEAKAPMVPDGKAAQRAMTLK